MKKLSLIFVFVAIAAASGFAYFGWRKVTQTPEAYFDRGKICLDQKKYQEALIEFLNAVRQNPRYRDGRFQLARTYVKLQDINSAVKNLRSLLEYYPDDVEANIELGNLL